MHVYVDMAHIQFIENIQHTVCFPHMKSCGQDIFSEVEVSPSLLWFLDLVFLTRSLTRPHV